MFRFANPEFLYLLLIIPVLIAGYAFVQYRMSRQIKLFGDPRLLAQLMPDVSPIRRHVKFGLTMFALMLIVFMMARPQYGTRNEEIKRSGIEVMIAVDVSNSMLCEDVSPNRLQKAKMIVSKLVDQFDEDKVGLIAFAGNAITLLPMTSDYVSAKMFLDQLSPATVSVQGTNMAEAIQRALAGFSEKTNVGRALIFITDAEDNEPGAIEAAKEAKKAGVEIFVLSVGTESGGPIPMEGGTFKKDLSGNVVTTKLNEQIGKSIAQAAGGMYIHVDRTGQAQSILDDEIAKMQKEDISASMFSAYDEQFVGVAIFLFIVLIIELCIMERKNRILSRFEVFQDFTKRFGKKAPILLLLLCMSQTVMAQSTARDFIRVGNKKYRQKDMEKAETNYLKSLAKQESCEAFYNLGNTYLFRNDSLAFDCYAKADSVMSPTQQKRAMIYHNAGNIHYIQGCMALKSNQDASKFFQNAVNFYKTSLRCNPDDDETRYNLAMAMHQLKKSQQNGGGGGNDNQNKDDKKDQQQQQQQQDQQQQNQQQQNQQQEYKKDEMSDQAAEQLLQSAQHDEKNVQRKVQKVNAKRRSLEKDW